MLTIDQMREAVNLAMKIETGTIDCSCVLDVLRSNPYFANDLVYFWITFDEMTRNAFQTLVYEGCRQHCEKCLQMEIKGEYYD